VGVFFLRGAEPVVYRRKTPKLPLMGVPRIVSRRAGIMCM
jgi:hypothetical protein